MSASVALAAGRAFAEQQMTDACTIDHPTGLVTDQTTGVVTPTYSSVYTGVCKIQGAMSASAAQVGGANLAILSPYVHVPITVVGVVEGDVVTITACVNDPELVGHVFRVLGPDHKSNATARRLQCVETTS
jgi:Family of unknown function (DUF6093)